MTDILAPSTVLDPGLVQLGPLLAATRVRNVLRVNAVVSGLTGVAAATAAGPVGDLLGVADLPVRIVGLGLVSFATGVAAASGVRHSRLPPVARSIGAADALWVVATGIVVALGALSGTGVAVGLAVALLVATFAVLEGRGAAAVLGAPESPDAAPPFEAVEVAGILDAPVGAAWRVVTDHELYGVLAPNLGRVEVTAGNGPGLARRCYDNRGRSWAETCTLWDQGRRFAVTVDTGGYLYPLSVMRGSWWVEPLGPERSQAGMTFLFQPRPGPRGRAFVWVMQAGFPIVVARILPGWRQAARAAVWSAGAPAGGELDLDDGFDAGRGVGDLEEQLTDRPVDLGIVGGEPAAEAGVEPAGELG